jgi:hypothetical protein
MSSTINEDNIEFLVNEIDVDVEMNECDISNTTIGTDSVATCAIFLLDFLLNDEPCCFLFHYSYLQVEEHKCNSIEELLIKYLDLIWTSLKTCIENKFVSTDVLQNTKLSNFKLVVGGGDIALGKSTREAFSLLKDEEMNVIINLCVDEDILHFYKQLIKKTIILKSVARMKNIDTRKRKRGELILKHFKNKKLVFVSFTARTILGPSLWIKYCCISKNTTLGIEFI